MKLFIATPKFIPFLLIILFLSACTTQIEDPHPPELMLGSDTCVECGMLVSEAKYAAATLVESGHTHKFDDLAEMFIFQADNPEDVVRAWFVHDYNTETWMRGETAFYVKSGKIRSPMNYGVAAFETREAAEAFATEMGGEVFTFDEIRAEIVPRS
jgi:copper chaperone NosL